MQLLKCKREEIAKGRNKEAFCCVLEGVSFLQLRSKFAACLIDVLLFGSFFFQGLVFWELLLLWWCCSSSSSSSSCVCREINLPCFCFLGGVFLFGTFVFFWWVFLVCLLLGLSVCVRILLAVCDSCWNLSTWVWKFLFVVVVVVCLSSLERMGFWDKSLLIVCGLL